MQQNNYTWHWGIVEMLTSCVQSFPMRGLQEHTMTNRTRWCCASGSLLHSSYFWLFFIVLFILLLLLLFITTPLSSGCCDEEMPPFAGQIKEILFVILMATFDTGDWADYYHTLLTLFVSFSSEDGRHPAQTAHVVPKLRTSSAETHEVRHHCCWKQKWLCLRCSGSTV